MPALKPALNFVKQGQGPVVKDLCGGFCFAMDDFVYHKMIFNCDQYNVNRILLNITKAYFA